MSLASKMLVPTVLMAALSCYASPLLRVCADPKNLPYSNEQGQGFENRLAQLIANDLGVKISYFWFPQRDTFFRKTLKAGVCDVVMGVPIGSAEADTTSAYYRSSYALISRRDRNLRITSLDDPRLRQLRIGVHVLDQGEDATPPVFALASRGITRNVAGYSIFGTDLMASNAPADLIQAVASGRVDIAIAWGPIASYFARHSPVPLDVTPIDRDPRHPELPLSFSIGIGVRKGDTNLERQLNAEVLRLRPQIARMLKSYGIPQLHLVAPSPSRTGN